MTTGPTDEESTAAAGGPGGMPAALRLSEVLGAWWSKLTHKHAYRQRRNWGILDGQLICLRTTQCDECGHKMEQALLLIATAEELAEAHSKQMVSPKAPNVGSS
jgi:hypothetical protein